MKYCRNCGSKQSDSAVYCTKCGNRMSAKLNGSMIKGLEKSQPKNQNSKLTMFLAVIVGIMVTACVLLLISINRNTSHANGGRENDTANAEYSISENKQNNGNSSSTNPVSIDDNSSDKNTVSSTAGVKELYYAYYNNTIIPEKGLINDEHLESQITINDLADDSINWHIRTGVIGADFADLDSDDNEDMIVYYLHYGDSEEDATRKADQIFADVYTIKETNTVHKLDTVYLGEVSGTNGLMQKIGIITVDEHCYIYQYEYDFGIVADGWRAYYALYTLDNKNIRKKYILGNQWLGSSEETFNVDTYTDNENYSSVCYALPADAYIRDSLSSQGVIIADDYIEYTYNNAYECQSYCWKKIGVEVDAPEDALSGDPDYWNTDLVKGGFELIVNGSYEDYDNDLGMIANVYSELNNRTSYKTNNSNAKDAQNEINKK